MQVIAIDSLDDPRLHDYVGLTDVALRRRTEPERGLYIAESQTVLARALRAGHEPRSVLVAPRWLPEVEQLVADRDVPVFVGEEPVLERLTGFHLHRGALAAMQRPVLPDASALLASARRVVVLDGLVDHTNVGAAFRSVAGIGADAVLVTGTCADPLYRRSVRVSMGTVLQVPWTRIDALETAMPVFREAGFEVVAMALADDAVDLAEYALSPADRVALVFGSEGPGLSRRAIAAADRVVRIPMHHGVDSLNVAASAAVAMWALR
ncbi:RNA methyltransferase [Agrococcus sp. BE272]|uniref:TrmH family RNA methyltransferase n=1 Tax=Agrococcus sp. BE272 TaxID=2817727 RepID=UPI00286183AC|nr:RNA methyltransferase [Agrococcus sp. BE272]MDR7234701.1 tRNA G18 (ribose-2'-O)-methylase SpoU [Agrococcus sp. BE272]